VAHDVIDQLDERLLAARPTQARPDEHAFDADLLARVRELPVARRSLPRVAAAPVVAGVTLTAAAVVMLGGGPGDVGGPSSAAAITQALHWLNPPPGTVLHTRSVETQGDRTTTRETWRSADHPDSARQRVEGATTFETAGDALYDAASNTIYTGAAELAMAPPPTKAGDQAIPAGDPIVTKVRMLLSDGRLAVSGREDHNGTDAWAISLKPSFGEPVWTLWVSAADGKPLELRDPGRDASEQPQVIRWPTYEVVPASGAESMLTLTGAHPSAHVVHDPAAAAAAAAADGLIPAKR
jgi:hypothetical protein